MISEKNRNLLCDMKDIAPTVELIQTAKDRGGVHCTLYKSMVANIVIQDT